MCWWCLDICFFRIGSRSLMSESFVNADVWRQRRKMNTNMSKSHFKFIIGFRGRLAKAAHCLLLDPSLFFSVFSIFLLSHAVTKASTLLESHCQPTSENHPDKNQLQMCKLSLCILAYSLHMWPAVVKWGTSRSSKQLILHLVQIKHCMVFMVSDNHLDQYFQFVKDMLCKKL